MDDWQTSEVDAMLSLLLQGPKIKCSKTVQHLVKYIFSVECTSKKENMVTVPKISSAFCLMT
jgi:hypothetical protein